jgi:large subunit ribosomal protein L23
VHPYEVIRKPLVTEKSTDLRVLGKYAFEVAQQANKQQVKEAVEKAFKVTVTAVNVVTVRGKMRRIGRRQIMTQSWKKALVTLKPGDTIQLFEGV